MSIIKKIGCLILLFTTITIGSSTVSAQVPRLTDQYTTTDGLAINGITDLCRDRRGYLWIATYDGLNRYNGHSFTTYNRQNTSQALYNNRVRSLKEAPNGDIWIGTDNGLSLFDYNTNIFTRLSLDEVEHSDINCIIVKILISADNSEVYCVTESDGILVYGTDRQFKRQQKFIDSVLCYDAMELDSDILLLSTSNGIEYHNLKSGEKRRILSDKIPSANTILKISTNTMIVAPEKGIQIINISRRGKEYSFDLSDKVYYHYHTFKTLALDEMGRLWLGSKNNGVRVLALSKMGVAGSVTHDLPNTRISTMLFEDNGTKWVATYDNGVYRYDDQPTIFSSIAPDDLKKINKIVQVIPYSDERLLLHSISNQLTIYNINRNQLEALPFSITEFELNSIRRISQDSSGRIWCLINDDNGSSYFVVIEPNTDNVKRIYHDSMPQVYAYDNYVMTNDHNGDLWICAKNEIYRVSLNKDMTIRGVESLSDNEFFDTTKIHSSRVVYADAYKNQIWIGCYTDGLFRLELGGAKSLVDIDVTHYVHDELDSESLSSDFVSTIYRAPDGILWVGTEQGGLCRVYESGETLRFKRYSVKEGLSNHVVKSIESDHNGDLWISTNIGLNHFSTRNERFTIYRADDGIPFENFNYNSLKLQSGRMIFSGINNIMFFNPVDLKNREERPSMWFSSLRVNNNDIQSGELVGDRVILDKALSNGDVIDLKYDENVIAIGVDAICNTYSDNYKIEYKLEPLSKSWTTILASTNKIQFDGLQPDNYKLSVRCCNFYGIWSDPMQLTLHIAPPIWKTTTAYVIYGVLILIILSLSIYILLHILSLRHQLQIELISKRNLENLNREKQRYFSNISHELKTPLTLILAPIAVLTEKFKLDISVTNSLQVINRQSKKMLQLIELAHNVQLESDNLLTKKPSIFDFNMFLHELTSDFKYYADSDNKTLTINRVESDVIVEADRGLIEKIINNLLSNAFKHTRQEDRITLSYHVENELLTLTVEDSGYGIDEADLPRIFERFYQAKRRGAANIGGTGIGLTFSQIIAKLHGGEIDVESKFGEGTKFTVRLPIVVDTSLFEYDEDRELATKSAEDLEATLILGDMNIESISVREDLQDSMVYLVEDNLDMRKFLESIISQFYNVKSFSNGVECLEAMKSAWPDIVLSDVMMPQMDGYELCSRIKNDALTSHIPVIMLTACSTIDEKIKGLSCGADSYIPKPFYPKHTITRIDALLYNRKKLRERFLVDEAIMKGPNSGNRDNEFINNLYKFFSDNLSNEDIDIDNIAMEMGVSRTLFFQKIKAITNDSPYELLKNYRLKRAAEYLSMSDVQVVEVSFLVGFKSRTHFSKLFKEKYGHTPGKYAKLAKNKEL